MLYEITLKAVCTVVVEAEDVSEAADFAVEAASSGDYEFIGTEPAVLLEGEETIERAKRHAELVLT